jgi:heme A synthase
LARVAKRCEISRGAAGTVGVSNDAGHQVSFAGSIFTALLLLLPAALLAFYTQSLLTNFKILPTHQLVLVFILIYLGCVLSAFLAAPAIAQFLLGASLLCLFTSTTCSLRVNNSPS